MEQIQQHASGSNTRNGRARRKRMRVRRSFGDGSRVSQVRASVHAQLLSPSSGAWWVLVSSSLHRSTASSASLSLVRQQTGGGNGVVSCRGPLVSIQVGSGDGPSIGADWTGSKLTCEALGFSGRPCGKVRGVGRVRADRWPAEHSSLSSTSRQGGVMECGGVEPPRRSGFSRELRRAIGRHGLVLTVFGCAKLSRILDLKLSLHSF